MGERVAIQFVNGSRSAFLTSEWGGKEFVQDAVAFVEEAREQMAGVDVGVLMVCFVRYLTEQMGYAEDCFRLLVAPPTNSGEHVVWEIVFTPDAPARAMCVIRPYPNMDDEEGE